MPRWLQYADRGQFTILIPWTTFSLVNLNVAKKTLKTSPPPFPPPKL